MPGPVATFMNRPRLPGEAPVASRATAGAMTLARPAAVDPVATLAEKVRTATLAGRVTFLPWLDPYTEETAAMRRMYPVMLRNPVVKQSLQHKVQSVAELDLQVTPADETERDHEVADFVRYTYTTAMDGGLLAIAEELLYPMLIFKGVVAEKVWFGDLWPRGKYKGKRLYRCFKAKEYAEPLYDEFRNLIGVRATGFGQNEIYPATDFVAMKNLALFQGPGMSDLRAAYLTLWQLDTVEKLHLIHLERYLTPVVAASYTEAFQPGLTDATTGQTNQQTLEANLAEVRARGWLMVPDSVKIESLTLATRGEAEFLEKCKDLREQLTLSIAGAYLQMLTATSGGDIRGNSKVQGSTAELLVWELAARLAGALNSQATPQLVEMNYAGADYPAVTLGGISYEEMLQAIEIDKTAQSMGMPISKRATARKYSLQLATDDDDTLKPAAPVLAGPGFGGGSGGGGGSQGGQQGGGSATSGDPTSGTSQRSDGGDGSNIRDSGGDRRSFSDGSTKDASSRETTTDTSGKDVALAGADGRRAEQLLSHAQRVGAATLATLTERALRRLYAVDGPRAVMAATRLFSPGERRALTASLAATTATATLLGAARIRRRADQVAVRVRVPGSPQRFSDEETDLRCFDEGSPLAPMAPAAAVDYFRRLVPGLSSSVVVSGGDAERFAADVGRRAFTLAVSTDEVVLRKVQEIIARNLETGGNMAPAEIDAVLADAGVSHANPFYSEMVVRTNMMDAMNEGAQQELNQVADLFPGWVYSNPADDRSRPTHAARNGKLYPTTAQFKDVRGRGIEDAANCRCVQIPVDKYELEERLAAGEQIETMW